MNFLEMTLEDYALIPPPGKSFRKPDYTPLPYYVPLSINLGHFLFHHLDVLPVQCKASESNAFRQKLDRFHVDINLKNQLLALYLYCHSHAPDSMRLTSGSIRKRIRQCKSALKNPVVSDKEKARLEIQMYIDNQRLSSPLQGKAHRPKTETYYHAAVYVLGQIYKTGPDRYRKIGRLFERIFDKEITRNIIEKILNFKPEEIKHAANNEIGGWRL